MRHLPRRTRSALAVLATAALLGGCVQFGSGRGRSFDGTGGPGEDFEGEQIVEDTGDDVGVEAEEVPDGETESDPQE